MRVINYHYGLDLSSLISRHIRTVMRGLTTRKLINLVGFALNFTVKSTKSLCRPFYLKIEPTNVCNLRCPECGSSTPRAKGFMEFSLYKNIIDYFKNYCVLNGLYGQGESFLHPRIFDMISYSESRSCPVSISTNFNTSSSERCRELLDSGLSYIIICIDGPTQQLHASYRRSGDLAGILKNMRTLAELKESLGYKSPVIEVQSVDFKYTKTQLEEMSKLARDNGADVHRIRENMLNPHAIKRVKGPCPYLYGSLFFSWDGRIAPCEGGFMEPQHFISSVKDTEKGIDCWNDKTMKNARALQKGQVSGINKQGIKCETCYST